MKLSREVALVHPVFHVSMLKKYFGHPVSIFPIEGLGVDENLLYEEVPIKIPHHQVNKLWNKEKVIVKVLWRNHLVEGEPWEVEDA